MDEVKR